MRSKAAGISSASVRPDKHIIIITNHHPAVSMLWLDQNPAWNLSERACVELSELEVSHLAACEVFVPSSDKCEAG